MLTLNQTQFATHMGWSKGYVSQLKTAGRLVFAESGKVDVEASKVRIAETEDPNRDDVKERHASARSDDSKVHEIGVNGSSKAKKEKEVKDPNKMTFSTARAKEQEFKALQAELDYKERIGELVSKADMKAAVADMVTTFRQEIENLPHRISADLVGKDINEIRAILKRSVHDCLANLERGCEKKLNQEISL
jgi:hypothetical protein